MTERIPYVFVAMNQKAVLSLIACMNYTKARTFDSSWEEKDERLLKNLEESLKLFSYPDIPSTHTPTIVI